MKKTIGAVAYGVARTKINLNKLGPYGLKQ